MYDPMKLVQPYLHESFIPRSSHSLISVTNLVLLKFMKQKSDAPKQKFVREVPYQRKGMEVLSCDL